MPTSQISSFEDLISFVNTQLLDNNSGLIDPLDVRTSLLSLISIQSLNNEILMANFSPEQTEIFEALITKLEQIQRESKLGIVGNATQANAPTVYDAGTYPNGLFESYVVRSPVTSPNSWGNLTVSQLELDNNFVYFDVKNGLVTKVLSKKERGKDTYQSYLDTTTDSPKKTETEWSIGNVNIQSYNPLKIYLQKSQFTFNNNIYEVKIGQTLLAGEDILSSNKIVNLSTEGIGKISDLTTVSKVNAVTSINEVNAKTSVLQDNIDDLDERVSLIVTTPAEGVSQAEIIDARQGKTSLGDNIRAIDAKFTSVKSISALQARTDLIKGQEISTISYHEGLNYGGLEYIVTDNLDDLGRYNLSTTNAKRFNLSNLDLSGDFYFEFNFNSVFTSDSIGSLVSLETGSDGFFVNLAYASKKNEVHIRKIRGGIYQANEFKGVSMGAIGDKIGKIIVKRVSGTLTIERDGLVYGTSTDNFNYGNRTIVLSSVTAELNYFKVNSQKFLFNNNTLSTIVQGGYTLNLVGSSPLTMYNVANYGDGGMVIQAKNVLLKAKNKGSASIINYGAKSNKSIDDLTFDSTLAIQKAFDSDYNVTIPTGFFYITETLIVSKVKDINLLGKATQRGFGLAGGGVIASKSGSTIYSDLNIDLILIQSRNVNIDGGNLDQSKCSTLTKSAIKYDMNFPILGGKIRTSLKGNKSAITSLKQSKGISFDTVGYDVDANGYATLIDIDITCTDFAVGVYGGDWNGEKLWSTSLTLKMSSEGNRQAIVMKGKAFIYSEYDIRGQATANLTLSETETVAMVELESIGNTIDMYVHDMAGTIQPNGFYSPKNAFNLIGRDNILVGKSLYQTRANPIIIGGSPMVGSFGAYPKNSQKLLNTRRTGDDFFDARFDNWTTNADKLNGTTGTIKAYYNGGAKPVIDLPNLTTDSTTAGVEEATSVVINNVNNIFNEQDSTEIIFNPYTRPNEMNSYIEIVLNPIPIVNLGQVGVSTYERAGNFKSIQTIWFKSGSVISNKTKNVEKGEGVAHFLRAINSSINTVDKVIIRLIGFQNTSISVSQKNINIVIEDLLLIGYTPRNIPPYITPRGGQKIFGNLDLVSLNSQPPTGTYTLKSVNGVLTWVTG